MTYELRHLKEKVEFAPFLVGAQKFALKALCSKALRQSHDKRPAILPLARIDQFINVEPVGEF